MPYATLQLLAPEFETHFRKDAADASVFLSISEPGKRWDAHVTLAFTGRGRGVDGVRALRDACDAYVKAEEDKAFAEADAALAAHRAQVDAEEGEHFLAAEPVAVGTPEAQAMTAGFDALAEAMSKPPDEPLPTRQASAA